VLDECNDVIDYSIARHIINTHRGKSRATQTVCPCAAVLLWCCDALMICCVYMVVLKS
jgi:hypothetical protein